MPSDVTRLAPVSTAMDIKEVHPVQVRDELHCSNTEAAFFST